MVHNTFDHLHKAKKQKYSHSKVPAGVFCMSQPVVHVDHDKDTGMHVKNAFTNHIYLEDGHAVTALDANKDVDLDLHNNGSLEGERVLLNGDFYAGCFQGPLPEGKGKYLWADGCMYEGEWEKGKKTGRGKISWPSGATYEGDFAGGYMHGVGIYTAVDGTTYKGNWNMNIKHGLGRIRYSNGDVYEGSWKLGAQEGPGRYTWANGNIYMGDWKGGVMSGKGTLTWASGDVFDGEWLNGLEHGHGVYYWPDGSLYVGTWSRGLKDGKGVFYPAGSLPAAANAVHILNKRERVFSIDELIATGKPLESDWSFRHGSNRYRRGTSLHSSNSENIDKLMRKSGWLERRWSLEGSFERVMGLDSRSLGDSRILESEENSSGDFDLMMPPILEREYAQGVLINEYVKLPISSAFSKSARRRSRRSKEIKRPGETIYKGHRSYDLMLSLQLGIRYSVGKMTAAPKHEICSSDFGSGASCRMKFPRLGSQLTPCHHSVDFVWKDYCPKVFRRLREMFGIDAADYMLSICGNNALRELSSPGKSGSVFFWSHDDRFIIKTMRKAEVKALLRMLQSYYRHVHTHENTLITKFFGLHRVKPWGGRKVRFIVMGNMFCTDLRIHRRYDLKGSRQGRLTERVDIDENTTLKDLDLDFVFCLEPTWRDALLKQIKCDCQFLESQHIMDYSLLLGLHFRAPQYPSVVSAHAETPTGQVLENDEYWQATRLVLVPREPGQEVNAPGLHIRGSPLRAAGVGDAEVDLLLPGTARLQIQLGVNMPARAERKLWQNEANDSEFLGEVYDVVLYLGIIDILQEYDITKRIEHAVKSLQFDPFSISAVNPKLYSERFQNFIRKIFPPNSASEA